MTQIAYSGSFWTQLRVSRDVFTDLTTGKTTVRTFLPRLLTAASRIQSCTYRKIITYRTPHSNLPNEAMWVSSQVTDNSTVCSTACFEQRNTTSKPRIPGPLSVLLRSGKKSTNNGWIPSKTFSNIEDGPMTSRHYVKWVVYCEVTLQSTRERLMTGFLEKKHCGVV